MHVTNPGRDRAKLKQRDMARSVLPSTRRRDAAQNLAAIHRNTRRTSAQRLGRFNGRRAADTVLELDELELDDLELRRSRRVRDEVTVRRYGDKLGPLRRWAVRSTVHLRPQDRLSYLSAGLPGNLIGRHAISHLVWIDELNPQRPWDSWSPTAQRTYVWDDIERARIAHSLRQVLAEGGHGAFNALVRMPESATLLELHVCRPLLGFHDVERFIDELAQATTSRAIVARAIVTWALDAME